MSPAAIRHLHADAAWGRHAWGTPGLPAVVREWSDSWDECTVDDHRVIDEFRNRFATRAELWAAVDALTEEGA